MNCSGLFGYNTPFKSYLKQIHLKNGNQITVWCFLVGMYPTLISVIESTIDESTYRTLSSFFCIESTHFNWVIMSVAIKKNTLFFWNKKILGQVLAPTIAKFQVWIHELGEMIQHADNINPMNFWLCSIISYHSCYIPCLMIWPNLVHVTNYCNDMRFIDWICLLLFLFLVCYQGLKITNASFILPFIVHVF